MNYFVTGGSRGIGAGIVFEAIKEGNDVAFAYARNKDAAKAVSRYSTWLGNSKCRHEIDR